MNESIMAYTRMVDIFNLLLMREAHEVGLVDDETYKDFIKMIFEPISMPKED